MAEQRFSQMILERLPKGMELPSELIETFDWLEDQGWRKAFSDSDEAEFENHFLSIYPLDEMDAPGTSFVTFNTTSLTYTQFWETPVPAVDTRIFEIARTSGDGGRAALWLDPDGKQWFVHLGHDELGIISDDATVFLTFLGMGYLEPGGFANTALSPMEHLLEYHGFETVEELEEEAREDDMTSPPVLPTAFQSFLQERFGVSFPERASDLGIGPFDEYGTENSSDAFVQWLNSVTPEPSEEELAYIKQLAEMAEKVVADLDKPSLTERIKSLFGKKNDD